VKTEQEIFNRQGSAPKLSMASLVMADITGWFNVHLPATSGIMSEAGA
jgi:hypothetical protein